MLANVSLQTQRSRCLWVWRRDEAAGEEQRSRLRRRVPAHWDMKGFYLMSRDESQEVRCSQRNTRCLFLNSNTSSDTKQRRAPWRQSLICFTAKKKTAQRTRITEFSSGRLDLTSSTDTWTHVNSHRVILKQESQVYTLRSDDTHTNWKSFQFKVK